MNGVPRLPETRILLTLQIVCALSALASLPGGLIHPLWLLTFIVPSALFLFLGSGARRELVPIWVRFGAAAVAQGAAAFGAYHFLGPLDEKSALACSLLPALTYFTLRREPSDTSLSLFLSFCFLLIGIMLNDDAANWSLLVFLLACAWAMQIEARNRVLLLRHATRGRMMAIGTRILRRSQVVAALMMVAVVVYQGIAWIPSPGRTSERTRSATTSTDGHRVLGLNSRFDLSGNEGNPLNLTADRVIHVDVPGPGTTPSDLYLRMTYFDFAFDNEEWKIQTPRARTRPVNPRGFSVRAAAPGLPIEQLVVSRLEPAAEGEIFLPPGTLQIGGLRQLQFALVPGYFRSPDPDERRYSVIFQRPHKQRRLGSIDGNLVGPRLTQLPPGLRTPELVRLSNKWAGPEPLGRRPMQVAREIAGHLERRCRYALAEPSGPYQDPLHNFLFGKNEGYCMHFATALAVLLRIQGIPCRIAVGFHAGEPTADGARIFGSQHAHAWVELPLRRTGWTLVDPTPAANRAQRGWPDPRAAGAQDPGPAANGDGLLAGSCFIAGLRDPLSNPGAVLSLALLLTALTIGLLVLAVRRSRTNSQRPTRPQASPDTVKARRMLDQILTLLARCGHPKHNRATLEQYLDYLQRSDDLDLTVLAGAFDAYQDVRFGAKQLDAGREQTLAAAIAAVKAIDR